MCRHRSRTTTRETAASRVGGWEGRGILAWWLGVGACVGACVGKVGGYLGWCGV